MTAGQLLIVLVFGPLLWWRLRIVVAAFHQANGARPTFSTKMPPARPHYGEHRRVRWARNVAWIRRHPGQPP